MCATRPLVDEIDDIRTSIDALSEKMLRYVGVLLMYPDCRVEDGRLTSKSVNSSTASAIVTKTATTVYARPHAVVQKGDKSTFVWSDPQIEIGFLNVNGNVSTHSDWKDRLRSHEIPEHVVDTVEILLRKGVIC